MWLLIAFIAVPLIEIGLFIQVGGLIGLFPTLAIVLVTAVLGTWLVRTQGAMALGQLRTSFSDLRDPTEPLVHGAMILFAGALLLTPGFFTDAVGFAFLVPSIRQAAYKALRARVNVQSFGTPGQGAHHGAARPASQGDVIDADYHEIVDEAPRRNDGPSGWTKH
ncbi:FxsA family protein [Sulfitobacter sp. M57]|uniref:FxsA family protein n=1 Tax=unclassified Sulfitobacter TaxID=196795 RepID=UPI0023E3255B|nr:MULTISPECIES: FxsA family protein [unclassified Sulfitobacter]MDF3415008.1 FxsA family protein [Sulfitobacter sp. KE5]MDF3422489.1 FxsA family protein [Sulfitobacter sp. KE43]MDF3433554.1 FxsA family protein [Sulfitobacter sp. KE42]MDF3459194.1 FxsA family protein [Sulfitobacter sp. S74]MDF3463093.1 FxsA family protein [Sulfitobacter sp. Ks18]